MKLAQKITPAMKASSAPAEFRAATIAAVVAKAKQKIPGAAALRSSSENLCCWMRSLGPLEWQPAQW